MTVKAISEGSPRKIITLILASFCLFLIIRSGLQPEYDPDLSWHLKMAQDYVESGLSMFQDRLSFTHQGQEMRNPYVLFELSVFGFYKVLGPLGVQIFKILCWLLVCMTFVVFCRKNRINDLITFTGLQLLIFVLVEKFVIRPDTIAPAFFFMLLTIRGISGEHYTKKSILVSYVLMVIWTNWHSTSIYAYLFAAAVMFDVGIHILRKKSKDFKLLGMDLALWIGSGFLNPDLLHPVLPYLQFSGDNWGEFIGELARTKIENVHELTQITLGLIVLSSLVYWRQAKIGLANVVYLFVYQAHKIARMPVVIASLWLPLVVKAIQHIFDLHAQHQIKKSVYKLIVGSLGIVTLYGVYCNVNNAFAKPIDHTNNEKIYPIQFLNSVKSENRSGNLLAEYHLGSFVVLNFPELKIFIDGRTNILYHFDFMKLYSEATHNFQRFMRVIDEYPISHLLVRHRSPENLAQFALKSNQFSLVNFNNLYLFLRRGRGALDAATVLVDRPWCFSNMKLSYIEQDRARLSLLLDQSKDLEEIYGLLFQWHKYDQTKIVEFVLKNSEVVGKSDFLRRIFGYIAEGKNERTIAFDLFNGISQMNTFDIISVLRIANDMKEPHAAFPAVQKLKLIKNMQPWEALPLKNQLDRSKPEVTLLEKDAQTLDQMGATAIELGFKDDITCGLK